MRVDSPQLNQLSKTKMVLSTENRSGVDEKKVRDHEFEKNRSIWRRFREHVKESDDIEESRTPKREDHGASHHDRKPDDGKDD